MHHIKIKNTIILLFLFFIISCKKNFPTKINIQYEDRVAQDTNYRKGKWYSTMPWTNQAINPDLDTIWFINDSLAGWTGQGGNPYVFWKTYFPDPYHIAVIRPGVSWQPPGTIDTVISECGMSATGDTFDIWDKNGAFNTILYQYVKR